MNNEHAGEISYDYAPQSSGGKYLRLKNKGDSAIFRIVSNPCRFYADIVDQKTGDTIRKERFGWIVAHKEQVTSADGTKSIHTTLKGFEAGVAIWLAIRKFAQDEENYGDPRNYDFKITRTEAAGNYYDVTVMPKSIGKPIEGLDALMAESSLTLNDLFLKKTGQASDDTAYDPFTDE
jgi:hypothetical protein